MVGGHEEDRQGQQRYSGGLSTCLNVGSPIIADTSSRPQKLACAVGVKQQLLHHGNGTPAAGGY